MKEKILAALRLKYKSYGYSAKAIEAVADHLEGTVKEEGEVDAAVDGVDGLLKTFQSEIARLAGDKKKESEQQQQQQEGPKTGEQPKADDTPAWAKDLIESNKSLREDLTALKQKDVVGSRKSQLEAKLKDAPEAFKTATLKAFGRMTFTDDADFDSWLGETETEVATQIQSAADAGLNTLGQPRKGMGGENSKKEITPERAASIVNRM